MPTHPEATGMKPMIYYASEPVPLPEVEANHTLASRIKEAMVAESSLITSNVKVFLSTLGVVGVTLADMASDIKSAESWGIKALLLAAVLILARVIVVQQRDHKSEMKDMLGKYERALKKNSGDDDDEPDARPSRHRKK